MREEGTSTLLIAVEGVDASGKETQTTLLYERLKEEGFSVKRITFPDYSSRAAGALKMYLDGEFGKSPYDVNPYVASTFFTIDRFASYKTDWGEALANGQIIIADRYTMSNMIHQGAKIDESEELEQFLDWLYNLEFCKFKLPKPDLVLFLDMPMDMRVSLLESRSKIECYSSNRKGKDIHENDINYLERVHTCAQKIAKKMNWFKINTESDGKLRTIPEIQEDIYSIVRKEIMRYNK